MAEDFQMRFPDGKAKALTLSYDDNVEQDIRMIEILDRYGLKCTFNVNSGRYAPEGTTYAEGEIHRVMTRKQVTELYQNSGHEVAVHAYSHPHLDKLSQPVAAYQIMKDREALEEQFGTIIRGMAYPYGSYSDDVVEALRVCGILYSRTTAQSLNFKIPTDWLRLSSTCHHRNPQLMELATKFVDGNPKGEPWLFYVWGHTYEFEQNDNWNIIEDFAAYTGGKEEIWYATNIEIFEYIEDYKRLIFSINGKTVKNPTARTLYFAYDKFLYSVAPGETITL